MNISLNPILLKRLTITGSTLRSRSLEFKHQVAMEMYEKVWPLIEAGKLAPLIYATVGPGEGSDGKMPLDEVVRAHTMMEKNEQIGKIVLTMELGVCLTFARGLQSCGRGREGNEIGGKVSAWNKKWKQNSSLVNISLRMGNKVAI